MHRNSAIGGIVAVVVTAFIAASPASAQTYRFATGPEGSNLPALGKALKALWDAEMPKTNPNYQTTNVLTGDAVANVTAIEDGTADLAISNTIITNDAIEGRAPFTKKHAKVCQLALLYLQALQVFAMPDANIQTLSDLKGKTVAVPLKGDIADPVARQMLQVSGLTDVKTVPAGTKDALKMLQEGKVQAAMIGAPVPSPEIAEIGGGKPFAVVGVAQNVISQIETVNPGFLTATLEAGTYPGQNNQAFAAAYAAQILAPCDMIDRRAFNLTRIAVSNLSALANTEGSMKEMEKDMMGVELGTRAHPEAGSFHEGSTGNCPGGC